MLYLISSQGERPHKCSECPKTFVTKDTLVKHMQAHSDERQYQCGECGKMFKRISHVREHLKIHSSDRPYPCHYCDKSFKTTVSDFTRDAEDHLQNNNVVLTKDTPYV